MAFSYPLLTFKSIINPDGSCLIKLFTSKSNRLSYNLTINVNNVDIKLKQINNFITFT